MRSITRAKDRPSRYGMGHSAFHEAVKRGLIAPSFTILGQRAAGAFEDEDDEILALRAAGASREEIQNHVRIQIANRMAAGESIKKSAQCAATV